MLLHAGYEIWCFFVQFWGCSSSSYFSFSFDLQDEICKSIAESGGIDAILKCIDDSGEQGNKIVAKTCCSLLSKVQGISGSEFMFFNCLDEQSAYYILFD